MAGNTRGRMFRITTWGESHGPSVGAVVDGCPAGLSLTPADLQAELDRRRPGQSDLSSSRRETDKVKILSGVFEGETLGTPIGLEIKNRDARPSEYEDRKDVYRPSHADYTYEAKYGRRNWMGGGRASARETAARVAAGAIARKWLIKNHELEIVAWVKAVGEIELDNFEIDQVTRQKVESNEVRCPDPELAQRMRKAIETCRDEGNSLGGELQFVVRNVPAGWGEPVFDKLEAELGKALLSIPAVKGVQFGSGFAGARSTASRQNDEFKIENGKVRTRTNNSGGVQGGISNGMPLYGSLAFKPVPTISQPQETVNAAGEQVTLEADGRHDPCVLPRAVPVVESELASVLMDLALRQRAQKNIPTNK